MDLMPILLVSFGTQPTVTGCILILLGTLGMTAAFLSSSLITKVFILFSLFGWIWLLSVLGLSEPSLTPGGHTAASASVIQSLSLAITLLPAYFVYELHQQKGNVLLLYAISPCGRKDGKRKTLVFDIDSHNSYQRLLLLPKRSKIASSCSEASNRNLANP
jgi:hypothetical protein